MQERTALEGDLNQGAEGGSARSWTSIIDLPRGDQLMVSRLNCVAAGRIWRERYKEALLMPEDRIIEDPNNYEKR